METVDKLDLRKVQFTGGSSFVITLPKDWVIRRNINKNDTLGLMEQSDGTLLITTNIHAEKVHREKVIDAGSIEDSDYLFRLLIASYISGYSYIIVRSKKRLQPFVRDVVAEFTRDTIGPEIMEEDFESITLKDLLDPAEMPFDKTLKRMFILVKAMHDNALNALQNNDQELVKEVVSRDSDVDKLHWLVARQANIIMNSTQLSRKMEVTLDDAIHFFLISRIIERIGDHAVLMAQNIDILIQADVSQSRIKKIRVADEMASRLFSDSVSAWRKKDIDLANDTILNKAELHSLCESIIASSMKTEGVVSAAEGRIAESIRRTGEYSGDISELVINNLISKV